MSEERRSPDQTGRMLLILLAAAVMFRCGMVCVLSGNLTDDRDIYLGLARGLREARGLSIPGTLQATAFRPPLYPILLAAATGVSEPAGIAVLNILLGAGTVALTFRLGLRLGLPPRFAWMAGGIVAVDPLLLLYATFPMTETLCAFLTAAMLLAVCPVTAGDRPQSPIRRGAVAGLLFGLCVLSRPTFWVFGGLMAIRFLMRLGKSEQVVWRPVVVTVAAVILVVAAWPIRNRVVLGSPVVTTTHGGYTLLLGNNPSFYEEVVRQPWGTVWDGSRGPGQQVWVEGVHDEMRRDGIVGEVASNRWMSARAWSNIREQPGMFVRACLLRLARFWNIVPSGPAAEGLPGVLVWTVGGCYLLLFAGAAWGAVGVVRERPGGWAPVLLLIAGFTVVHLVYWSNARMRAPVMPAVAALAAAGCARVGGQKD